MNENTHTATHAAITTTQKIAAVVGGAGMGLSIADVTAWLQLIGAATGAIVGIWMVADKVIGLFKTKRSRK
jgi:ABC-type nickel/cobalt efflux system permease component RcnA